MKEYLLLLLLFNIGYSQATGLALYGIGEEIQSTATASLALGNSIFFSGNSKNISTGSPSSLWRSALTRYTIQSGMNYLTNPQFSEQFQHNLTYFSLIFPIGNKKIFGFGLTPAFRTNKLKIHGNYQYIGANESVTSTPIVYKSNYFVDGGISKLFLQYSQKLTSLYSIGIEYSFLFGNQYLNDKMWTYDLHYSENENIDGVFIQQIDGIDFYGINVDSTTIDKIYQFSGTVVTLEGRYTHQQQELVFRASVNGSTKILREITQTINKEPFTNKFDHRESTSISFIGLGYHYQFVENSGLIMEVHKEYALNISNEVVLFNIMPPHVQSLHLGTYYQIKNPKFGFWNNLNLKGGGYLKQLDFSGIKNFDYGFTFGFGLEYLANTQTIDIALRVGKKDSYILPGQTENYLSLHLGITTGEKWFMKSRRK